MDETGRAAWLNDALTEVFLALSESSTLAGRLIYKGARILDRRLNRAERASLDIDANLTAEFVAQFPSRNAQRDELARDISQSIARRVRQHDPVRYELANVRIDLKPPKAHPLGFDAFTVRIRLRDLRLPGVHALPPIEMDIAAPEALSAGSVAPLIVGDQTVQAYTLPRIAAEKLRAFLQSLPEYRAKLARSGDAVRAKDLYDLARILDAHPISDSDFWREVGGEFVAACRSRWVDCAGTETFEQRLAITQRSYETDSTIPVDRPWPEAEGALRTISAFLLDNHFLGLRFPLPSV
jgi:predicted nucleotidyltransferase component of viral defense system